MPTVVFITPMLYLAFLGLTLPAAWLLVPIVVLTVWVLPPMWTAPKMPNTFEN
jgi:hypothetical protein